MNHYQVEHEFDGWYSVHVYIRAKSIKKISACEIDADGVIIEFHEKIECISVRKTTKEGEVYWMEVAQ